MLIKKTEIEHCISVVREIYECYRSICIESDSTVRSVDDLIGTCSKYLEKQIETLELEITKSESPVLGCCIVSQEINNYTICYVQELNYCWKRFVICKEVFHAVLDNVDCYNMSIGSHIDEVTVAFPVIDSLPSPSVVSELLAEIAAMEFMFPYKDRIIEISSFSGNINYIAVAEKYKIPLVMVEKYLSDHYMESLKI